LRPHAGCTPIPPRLACHNIARAFRVITILFEIVDKLLDLYKWAVILAAVVSTLVAFGVLDTRNRVVWTIGDFLYRITEPALRPIRNMLPNFGGIDISPIVLIIAIYVVQMILARLYGAIVYGNVQGLIL
jgi:YggT family protein